MLGFNFQRVGPLLTIFMHAVMLLPQYLLPRLPKLPPLLGLLVEVADTIGIQHPLEIMV